MLLSLCFCLFHIYFLKHAIKHKEDNSDLEYLGFLFDFKILVWNSIYICLCVSA